jgi:hypothetical protein
MEGNLNRVNSGFENDPSLRNYILNRKLVVVPTRGSWFMRFIPVDIIKKSRRINSPGCGRNNKSKIMNQADGFTY